MKLDRRAPVRPPLGLAFWLAFSTTILVGTVLSSSALGSVALMVPVPGTPRTTVLTALLVGCLALHAMSQELFRANNLRAVFLVLPVATLVVSAYLLWGYFTGVDLVVDQFSWLTVGEQPTEQFPARPSVQTLVMAMLLGVVAAASGARSRFLRNARAAILLLAVLVWWLITLAYLYGESGLYLSAGNSGLGITTGLLFLLLLFAAFTVKPAMPPASWIAPANYRTVASRVGFFVIVIPVSPLLTRAIWGLFSPAQPDPSLILVLSAFAVSSIGVGVSVTDAVRAAAARKEREETLIKLAQRDEQLDRSRRLASIGSVAGRIGHEINNPLMGLRAYLTEVLDQETDTTLRGYLEKSLEQIDRVEKVSRALLHIGGQVDAETVGEIHCRDVTQSVIDVLAGQARDKGVSLSNDVAEDLIALGNLDGLQGALLNLVLNSIEAVEGHPGREVRITGDADLSSVRLRVHDSGPGLPDLVKNRLFEPWITTKDPSRGGGLGLSIAETSIRNQGGSLQLSNPGQPDEHFTLTLPVVR